ncbi:MAG TPA: hypothetical protein VGF71_08835 [Caulobacteraceae bacterium]|jgi:hypothetical protein
MAVMTQRPWSPRPTFGGAFGAVGALLAWTVAALAGLVIAAVVTVALVFAGVIGAAVLAFARAWPKRGPAPAEDDVIEARHVGGHTWVAYGFDHRG